MSDVTEILNAMTLGDAEAGSRLLPFVYEELRRLASQKLSREAPGQTLNATALVHEAYLRLVGPADGRRWTDSRHFFAAAATAMRRILIDNARRKRAERHGGGLRRQPLDDVAAPEPDDELLAVHEALDRLAEKEPLKAKLVELRYFAGLTGEQAAEILGISATTADRHWAYARAWLQSQVRGE
ncbi:MAG: sigma-70 family RNA polymerase sigma factor [Planctomycetia bacterium]|nr:sigma-70 family RNA polymerase sigma factor [Planctomycetia bacterium]